MKTSILLAPLALAPLFAFTGNPDTPELPKAFRDRFAPIPAGVLATPTGEEKMPAYQLSTTEVSNADYNAFVADVRMRGNAQLLARVLPDTTQWRSEHAYNEPYVVHYHAHPAYAQYPAVNISYEGAVAYCNWLQERMNAQAPAGKQFTVRLPSRSEWWYAANGGVQHMSYAWGGPALHNAKGCALANYRHVGDENVRRDPATGKVEVISEPKVYMGIAGALADNVDITAPVNSYTANGYGLFNMNGNVAEMLADGTQAAGGSWMCPGYDIRNESVMAFKGPSPEVGFRVLVEVR
ncbi:MAG TPA: SUMF1/EgtB/PvdO family nonheme iron enzyme [Flavobacteriales bacterium]|nr:SUMF1/EgtB/PvdO family nonheme iron enzyme [Flavobacteriales bacterium]